MMSKKIRILLIILTSLFFIYTMFFYFFTLHDISTKYNNLKNNCNDLKQQNEQLQKENKRLQKENKEALKIQQKIDWLSEGRNIKYIKPLSLAIYNLSKKYNIDKDLLISIAFVESSFRKYVKSHIGCIGYFQINPNVHNIDYNKIYEEYYNTQYACKILKRNLQIFDNDYVMALNAYNGWASVNNNYAFEVLDLAIKLKENFI